MLDSEELRRLIGTAKRGPLVGGDTGAAVEIGAEGLERLLPHRPPMLLVDGIDVVDLQSRGVRGHRLLRQNDLGFAGHFPDAPIYPGVLIVEAMGQLALTLAYFLTSRRVDVPAGVTPAPVRATHIHHASFIAPLRPGDRLTLCARVAHDDYTMIAIAQAWCGDTLAAFAICEVLVDA